MRPDEPNEELPPRLGLTVGFLGTIIIVLGYIIDAIGEGIELSETIRQDEIDSKADEQQQQQFSEIQKKLDFLLIEMAALKKDQNGCRNRPRHNRG